MHTTIPQTDLVRAVEVWRPSGDGGPLTLSACAYGDFDQVEAERRSCEYAIGDGLVGEVAASGRPVISQYDSIAGDLNDVPHSHLLAIPCMRGEDCRGVILVVCDAAEGNQAAFEIWRPNDRGELGLAEGWHPNLGRFGLISQYVKFPRRAGLPGKVWADRFPRVMGSLGSSQDFIRAAGARAEGLSTGLGIPIMRGARNLDSVVVMLSANRSPIARIMEVWALDPATKTLKIVSADYGTLVDLAPASRRLTLKVGEGIAGRVYRDQAPWVTWDLKGVEFPRGGHFSEYDFRWGIGLPVFAGGELRAVAVLIN